VSPKIVIFVGEAGAGEALARSVPDIQIIEM
jgi:hypothetical protein